MNGWFGLIHQGLSPWKVHQASLGAPEFHYTPKHGSWLNMAKFEFGVLIRQCLTGRIADKTILESEVNAWQDHRNAKVIKDGCRFMTAHARI